MPALSGGIIRLSCLLSVSVFWAIMLAIGAMRHKAVAKILRWDIVGLFMDYTCTRVFSLFFYFFFFLLKKSRQWSNSRL